MPLFFAPLFFVSAIRSHRYLFAPGKIYHIPSNSKSQEIWSYLDHREKDGYTLRTVDVFDTNEDGEEVVVEKNVRAIALFSTSTLSNVEISTDR